MWNSNNDTSVEYHTTIPEKRRRYLAMPDINTKSRISSSPRGNFDFQLRQLILNNDYVVFRSKYRLSQEQREYWDWFAGTLKVDLKIRYEGDETLPDYQSLFSSVLFTSATSKDGTGGIESTIGQELLYNTDLIHITNCDYEWRKKGLIEGYLAILGPSLGYVVTYIGDERYMGDEDRSKGEKFVNKYAIELTESWWRHWNNYLGHSHNVNSLVGIWTKTELLAKLVTVCDVNKLESCHNYSAKQHWCGNCQKCGFVKLYLAHLGKDVSMIPPLTDKCKQALRKEFADYQSGADFMRDGGTFVNIINLLDTRNDL